MTRIHALVIALAVAFAVVAGAFAAFRTTRLANPSTPGVSPILLAAQTHKLDDSDAALKRALRSHPRALPKVPKVTKPHVPTGTPPAIVRVVHVTLPATTTTAAPPPTTTTQKRSDNRRAATTTVTTTTTAPTTTTREHEHERESSDDGHERTSTTTTTTPSTDDAGDD